MIIERISTNFSGNQSSGSASGAGVSGSGRYIVYVSDAKDITGGAAGSGAGVYIRDMETGDIRRIDSAVDGGAVNGSAVSAKISSDGRYVTYTSSASNLVATGKDDNSAPDIFVFDRETGETTLVSRGLDGTAAEGRSVYSVISENGRYIAYISTANDMLPGTDNNTGELSSDVYVYDVVTGETRLWSYPPSQGGIGINQLHSVDEAGRPFYNATFWNVVNGERQYQNWSYIGTTKSAVGSVGIGGHLLETSDGAYRVWAVPPPNGTPYGDFRITATTKTGNHDLLDHRQDTVRSIINEVVLAAKGRFVVYTSNFDVLAQKNTDGLNLYLWDLDEGGVVRLAEASWDHPLRNLEISADGHWITFETTGPYDANDTNNRSDIYRIENPIGYLPGGVEREFPDGGQWIIGTKGKDELLGTGAADHIQALEDDDLVDAGGGDDVIFGNEGNDELYGGAGSDEISGGDGNDAMAGEDGDDLLTGGAGQDLLVGGAGYDLLEGGANNDELYGDSGDTPGPEGNDALYGEGGDDRLFGDGGLDLLDGGAGNDSLDGGDEDDLLYGGEGDDQAAGGKGNDLLIGDSEGTRNGFAAIAGSDTLDGGAGDDEIYGDFRGLGVGGGDDILIGGAGNDSLVGGQGNDRLYGEEDDDRLEGGFGKDLLLGGSGSDLLEGGTEDDELFGDFGGESDQDGNDGLYGGLGNDRLDGNGGEDVLSGGDGDDDLFGGTGKDVLRGDEGNDKLKGGEGDDLLEGDNYGGQAGDDTLDGGDGDDVLYGDVEGGGFGGGNDTLEGGDGRDRIYGGQGDDRAYGGDGDDDIDGGFGKDLIFGDEGNDQIEGGDGNDELFGDLGGNTGGDDAIFGGAGDDILSGDAGSDLLVGGEGIDTLYGNDGEDELFGDDGGYAPNGSIAFGVARAAAAAGSVGDRLDGGAGNDRLHASIDSHLIGGSGVDTFLFTATSTGAVIEDFQTGAGGDTIDISGLMDAIYYGNDFETNPFATGNLRLVERDGGTAILFDADGSGSDLAELVEVGFVAGTSPVELDGAITCTAYPDIVIAPFRTTVVHGSSDWELETLIGTDGADTILGGEGQDIIYGRGGGDDLMGGSDADTLYGESGRDLLQGGWGDDVLDGGTEDDLLIGGGGSDRIEGGSGLDTARFYGARAGYTVEELPDGMLRIVDRQRGSDGSVDLVSGVELFVFDGRTFTLDELLGKEPGPVNRAPTAIVIDNASIEENAAAGSVVGFVSATDPDGDAMTYSLDDDAEGRFSIDAQTGRVTGNRSFDHEAAAEYTIKVRVTDTHGLHSIQTLTITVKDVDEAPAALKLDGARVAENRQAGTRVGTATAIDPEGAALTYSLLDDAGSRFSIDAQTGEIRTTTLLDHEDAPAWTIMVRATDPAGNHVDLTQTIVIEDVNEAPGAITLDDAGVDENAAAGTLVGTASAIDPEGDAILWSLADDAGGRFVIDSATGEIRTTQAFDHEANASFNVVVRATDVAGAHLDKAVAISILDVAEEGPVARNDGPLSINEDARSINLWASLLANDGSGAGGLTIVSVDVSATQGSVEFDPVTQTLRYVADADAFDALATGAIANDSFTYTVRDASGALSTATAMFAVKGIADGVTRNGSIFSDTLNGDAGEDKLSGSLGNDTLNGLGGHDWLNGGLGNDKLDGGDGNDVLFGDLGNDTLKGGNGRDVLFGGLGDDTLWGGAGADSFHFGRLEGSDTIADFNIAEDQIILDDGVSVTRTKVQDVNRDGVMDLTLTLSAGTNVTVLGVSDASRIKYGVPDYWSDHQPGLGGMLDDIGDIFGGVFGYGPKLTDLGHGY